MQLQTLTYGDKTILHTRNRHVNKFSFMTGIICISSCFMMFGVEAAGDQKWKAPMSNDLSRTAAAHS